MQNIVCIPRFCGGMLNKVGWLMISIKKRNSSRTYPSSFVLLPTISQLVFSLNYYIGLEDDHDMGVNSHILTKNGIIV
jgi:hypothetical protein